MYKEITLENNVIVLSLPFVHHTELQNFLIAPRRCPVKCQERIDADVNQWAISCLVVDSGGEHTVHCIHKCCNAGLLQTYSAMSLPLLCLSTGKNI